MPYAKLLGYGLESNQPPFDNNENKLVYVPGNGETKSDPFKRAYIHFAPPGRSLFNLFSLKEAAKDLARYLQDLEKRDNVEKIHLAGISMGGATIILALSYLHRRGIRLTKLKKVLVMNTFQSLSSVIEDILSTGGIQLLLMPLLEIMIHVLYSLFIGSPISVFSVLLANVLSLVIVWGIDALLLSDEKFSRQVHDVCIKNAWLLAAFMTFIMVMLLNTSVALSSMLLYQALIIILPTILLCERSMFVKMFVWIMDCDLDVRAAYLSIKDKDLDFELTVQQVSNDQVIGRGARLLEDPLEQMHTYGDTHMFIDPINVKNILDF